MLGDESIVRLTDFGNAAYIKKGIAAPRGIFPFAAAEVVDVFKHKVTYLEDMADTFSMGVLHFEMCVGLNSRERQLGLLGWVCKSRQQLLRDTEMR